MTDCTPAKGLKQTLESSKSLREALMTTRLPSVTRTSEERTITFWKNNRNCQIEIMRFSCSPKQEKGGVSWAENSRPAAACCHPVGRPWLQVGRGQKGRAGRHRWRADGRPQTHNGPGTTRSHPLNAASWARRQSQAQELFFFLHSIDHRVQEGPTQFSLQPGNAQVHYSKR